MLLTTLNASASPLSIAGRPYWNPLGVTRIASSVYMVAIAVASFLSAAASHAAKSFSMRGVPPAPTVAGQSPALLNRASGAGQTTASVSLGILPGGGLIIRIPRASQASRTSRKITPADRLFAHLLHISRTLLARKVPRRPQGWRQTAWDRSGACEPWSFRRHRAAPLRHRSQRRCVMQEANRATLAAPFEPMTMLHHNARRRNARER